MSEFRKELAELLNRHSMENSSNTPDFVLADYLKSCLDVFNQATQARESWYGHHHSPGNVDEASTETCEACGKQGPTSKMTPVDDVAGLLWFCDECAEETSGLTPDNATRITGPAEDEEDSDG